MNKILFIIFMMVSMVCAGQTFTNGVYVKNGKTIEVDKKLQVITDSAYFSNDLAVKSETNTEFTVNSFFQEVVQPTVPSTAKFGAHSFSATIMVGSATVKYGGAGENSSCVISTPLADLELSNGTFYIKSSEQSVYVFALDGSLKVHNGKKEILVQKGFALVARPNDIGILEDKVSMNVEKVRVEVLDKLNQTSTQLKTIKNSTVFVNVDGKLIGIFIN